MIRTSQSGFAHVVVHGADARAAQSVLQLGISHTGSQIYHAEGGQERRCLSHDVAASVMPESSQAARQFITDVGPMFLRNGRTWLQTGVVQVHVHVGWQRAETSVSASAPALATSAALAVAHTKASAAKPRTRAREDIREYITPTSRRLIILK